MSTVSTVSEISRLPVQMLTATFSYVAQDLESSAFAVWRRKCAVCTLFFFFFGGGGVGLLVAANMRKNCTNSEH